MDDMNESQLTNSPAVPLSAGIGPRCGALLAADEMGYHFWKGNEWVELAATLERELAQSEREAEHHFEKRQTAERSLAAAERENEALRNVLDHLVSAVGSAGPTDGDRVMAFVQTIGRANAELKAQLAEAERGREEEKAGEGDAERWLVVANATAERLGSQLSRAKEVLREFSEAFNNRGETTSLDTWNERMKVSLRMWDERMKVAADAARAFLDEEKS